MKLFQFLCAFLFWSSAAAQGQRQVYHENLYWVRYQTNISLSTNKYLNAEIDNRRLFNPDIQNQVIMHLRFHYESGGWDFGAGVTGGLVYASTAKSGSSQGAVAELRPVMEGSYEFNARKAAVQNRLRIDHRFIEDDPGQSVISSSDYTPRARYRLQWKNAILKNRNGHPWLGCRISNEIMVNFQKNLLDQNRIYAACDVSISEMFSFEAGYIYVYQQRLGQEGTYFSRNVLRISILQKF